MLNRFLICLFCLLLFNNLSSQWIRLTDNTARDGIVNYSIDAISDGMVAYSTTISKDEYTSWIMYSDDFGSTWQQHQINTQYRQGAVDVSIGDSLHICYGTDNGKIFVTEDGGESWQLRFYDVLKTEYVNYIEMFNGRQGVAMGDHSCGEVAQILRTEDGGRSWVSVNDSAFGGISSDQWHRIDFATPKVGYFFPSAFTAGFTIDQGLYKTIDAGETWFPIRDHYHHKTMKFYDENIGLIFIYKTYDLYGINRTFDGGNSWEFFPLNIIGTAFSFLPENPAIVWMMTFNAVYCSRDTGRTWVKQIDLEQTYNETGYDMVMTEGGRGWVLTNYNLYYTDNGGGLTRVESAVQEIPQTFLVNRNYPNPFNSETVLSFSLQQASAVELSVISLRGEVVKTLLSRRCSAGSHRVIWNGCDDRSLPVAAGTYLARLRCGERAVCQKMVLLR
ncbi:hypothetical protein GF407_03290 [candidate division KSB1 bacterium]|nr:hypothetical protein [candidate division KSB1 bacterium]